MKIQGIEDVKSCHEVLVIPKGGNNIVFYFKAITDYSPFEALNPLPVAPKATRPDGTQFTLVDDEEYKKKLNTYAEQRTHWMFLESISMTEDLHWSTIDKNDPNTWGNYTQELVDFGFSMVEISKMFEKLATACGLTNEKIEEATANFIASRQEPAKVS